MEKEVFANRLITLRKRKGYTQQQLADILCVTNKAISRWETGEGYPDITLLSALSEALDVSCDELLSEKKDYSDIRKKDIQEYIPYGIAMLSLVFYYILCKLQVPLPLSFALLIIGFCFSIYLMLHHTNKKRMANLIRLQALLLYFPLTSLLTLILFIMYSGFTLSYGIIALFGNIQQTDLFSMNMFDISTSFVLLYVVSFIIVMVIYFIAKYKLVTRYGITWQSFTLKGNIEKEVSQEEQQKYMKKGFIACIGCFVIIMAVYTILYVYLANSIPANGYTYGVGGYYEQAAQMVSISKVCLILLIAICSILPIRSFSKLSSKIVAYLQLCWLWIFCLGIVLCTRLEAMIYVKVPMWWILIGLGVFIAYILIIKRKKNHNNESHK